MTERQIATKRILLPRDTNHRGEIFGGAILAEIDLAGAVEARCHTNHDVATVAIKEVEFKQPIKVGDTVTFYTRLVRIGNTSITVQVEVEASPDGRRAAGICVTAAEVVYVAIRRNSDGTIEKVPVKDPAPPTSDECRCCQFTGYYDSSDANQCGCFCHG